jgi:hypothetical protein
LKGTAPPPPPSTCFPSQTAPIPTPQLQTEHPYFKWLGPRVSNPGLFQIVQCVHTQIEVCDGQDEF